MVTSHLLSVSVTPLVLISACGLVTLALYNRLGVILARIRAFHQQKIELLKNLHEYEVVEQQMLMELLDSQIVGVTVKARMTQKSLFFLLAAIAAFLLCSLFAGVTELYEWVGIISLGMGLSRLIPVPYRPRLGNVGTQTFTYSIGRRKCLLESTRGPPCG